MVESGVLERIRGSLLEKRQTLTGWLGATPAPQRQVRLGPASDGAVLAQIQLIDEALDKAEDGTIGICQACCEPVETRLLEMDYTACVCLSHLSEAEQSQLETELDLSQEVQRALLPQEPPEISGVELAAFSRSAQIVGGDTFDFLRYRDGAHAIAIADAAGHGVSAGLLMASVQAALRMLIPESESPDEVLGRVNRYFHHNIHFTSFVTLFLARLDPAAHTLDYSNAGHNPPLLYRPKHNGVEGITWLGPTSAAVGLIEDFYPGVGRLELASGDILMLYTDGVTEAADRLGQPFGEGGLAAFVRDSAELTARELTQRLWRVLQEFTGGGPLADDATVVAIKVTAQGHCQRQTVRREKKARHPSLAPGRSGRYVRSADGNTTGCRPSRHLERSEWYVGEQDDQPRQGRVMNPPGPDDLLGLGDAEVQPSQANRGTLTMLAVMAG
jgi:hypothetical protein